MHVVPGLMLILAGGAVGVAAAFPLRLRLPGWGVVALAASAGATVAAGALLVQRHSGPGDWAAAIGALGTLAPLHTRFVLGPLGR